MRGQQVATRSAKNCSVRCPSSPAARAGLLLQALRDPLRQRAARSTGSTWIVDAVGRPAPQTRRRCCGHLVQPGQQHQRERAVVALRRGGQLLDGGLPSLPGLPDGDAIHDLPVGKQAQAAAGEHLAPVKVGAGHGVHGALGVACGAGGGADRVGRFWISSGSSPCSV